MEEENVNAPEGTEEETTDEEEAEDEESA